MIVDSSSAGMDHPLAALDLQGAISFEDTASAAVDFGNIYHNRPAAVVFPASVDDISAVIRYAGHSPTLTVAARGNGHSINGQAQALDGVVIDMTSLKGIEIYVGKVGEVSYADVSGGELWIDLLKACLHKGFAPRTWPDYLYLSVGGTLQCAGVGGQTFRYGPVISNVLQLEVVTGTGEVQTCSPTTNSDLFFASLGGLGQFGIVSKARILLAHAPQKVRWIRALYADFKAFTSDQERLITLPEDQTFDYLEGFVVCNNDDPVNGWGQVPLTPDKQVDPNLIPASSGPVLYCLELAKHFNNEDEDDDTVDQIVEAMLRPLAFVPSLCFCTDLPYLEFLNRVYFQECLLRYHGIWQAPHPWLCLFVPRSSVAEFDAAIFKKKLIRGVGGPMLLYPMRKSKWDKRSLVVTPDEEIFYLVSLLRSNYPPPKGPTLDTLLAENEEIVHISRSNGISFTFYMPHFTSPLDIHLHFGSLWHRFVSLKQTFDPLAILAPGQRIFPRVTSVNHR